MPLPPAETETKHSPPANDEDEEEEFYESLDRILSSSCSSTSASDDDTTADHHRNHHRPRRFSQQVTPRPAPPYSATGTPASATATPAVYEVWISEPSSVEERRRRLLHQMGLISDPSSVCETLPPAAGDLPPLPPASPPARSITVDESRSDGSADPNLVHVSVAPARLSVDGDKDDTDQEQEQCRIKNLDNGSEFIVKEIRQDGTWDRVKELGTGRQLTMEEFEMCVGRSPIVQELMRRQSTDSSRNFETIPSSISSPSSESARSPLSAVKSKKKGGWLRGIKHAAGAMVHYRHRNGDDKDTSADKGIRRLSSATDDSTDGGARASISGGPERIRMRQYGKSYKEFTGVFMTQEIHGHIGSIWSIKFSLDGRFLASAGEDNVIHVWEVIETEKNGVFNSCNGSLPADLGLSLSCLDGVNHSGERKRRGKVQSSRKSVNSDHLVLPDQVFGLGEKPVCSLRGHADDVLDLSWSKSKYLLSSSMDKTVRLWDISSRTCLNTFSHSDYVTCIQFNPVDDRYFISGSLDEKVRIWSVPDRKIVDWYDLHEMVTAACFTPDGQGALVGSHKGSCHLFDTSENKLHYKSQVGLRVKKRKSRHKKITGFQFVPGSSTEVLITSADSRIRVVNGVELVHKLKGFRNRSSQISASISPNGKHVICASEDSHVYIWRYDDNSSQPIKTVHVTQSYEHFLCSDVTVAVTWPGSKPVQPVQTGAEPDSSAPVESSANRSATWPEERLAWGLVIVTAGQCGQIRVFQNFGFPVHL